MQPIKKLKHLIDSALRQLELPQIEYNIEHPADESHGDYAANVAMVLFSQLKKDGKSTYSNPRELAEAIAQEIRDSKIEIRIYIESVGVAGPGFINFTLSPEYLINQMNMVVDKRERFGQNELLKGKKISVEYTDPNPFKEFHIGHLYSNIVGESIAKLKEASGATVWRGDFFGDVGMHAAKSIWGLIQKFEEEGIHIDKLGQRSLRDRIEYFGQAYAKGATAYKEDESAQEEIKQLNFLIFKAAQEVVLPSFNKDPEIDFDQFIKPSGYNFEEIRDIYRVGREWSLEYFETIYKRLGTKFDGYYPESLTGEYGYSMVIEGLKRGIFKKGEGGAIIFPGEKHGLHNRVFINALGLPTYETKDFGLAVAKHNDFEYDESYNVTGNEINEYFKVVLKALRLLRPDLGEATVHIGHGMVKLPEGKMSSRTGKILRGEWLLDEAKNAVLTILNESNSIPESEREDIAEIVGQGAVRYALLKQNIGEDVEFDFETSINFQGNSGPYLQYTHARCMSVLKKQELRIKNYESSEKSQKLIALNTDHPSLNLKPETLNLNHEELVLLRYFYRFPTVVAKAASEYAPHHICTYLYELAQRYNRFYNKHSILGTNEPGSNTDEILTSQAPPSKSAGRQDDTILFRLKITEATAQILKNGLALLGIKSPDRM